MSELRAEESFESADLALDGIPSASVSATKMETDEH
jgi:hypothetical protein